MDAETLTKAEGIARKLATELGEPALRLASDAAQVLGIANLAIGGLCVIIAAVAGAGIVPVARHARANLDRIGDWPGSSIALTIFLVGLLLAFGLGACARLLSPVNWVSAFSGELGLALRIVRGVTGG